MSDINVILISFSIGSLLLFFVLAIMDKIFKQNYIRSFSLLYLFVFISNISLIMYMYTEYNSLITLSLNLTIASGYFLYRGSKQLYNLELKRAEWITLLSIIVFASVISLFPNTEFINGSLFFLGVLFYYFSSVHVFYKNGLRREKSMSILLILMLMLMLIKPYLTEYEKLSIWITLIQGYLGLVLALYLIFIHLYRVEITNQQQQKDLEYLSFHDTLTGVYNRTYLNQLLTNQTLIKENPLVAVMMDMNNLKMINDTHGHDAGDYAIASFAASIKSIVRKDDLVIRRSGDEFLLFLPNTDELKAEAIVNQIKKQTESFSIEGLYLSISTGYAILSDQNQSILDIISQADRAMYQDKRKIKKL